MKTFSALIFLLFVHLSYAQLNDVKKTEQVILTAFMNKDTQTLKTSINDDFILIHASGISENKMAFLKSSTTFPALDNWRMSVQHEKLIVLDDLIILNGVQLSQWQESGKNVRSKTPYTDTYKKINGSWQLISSYLNDLGEDYYELKDTEGIRTAIATQYERMDNSVEQKDLCTNLNLKTTDFSTIDNFGNRGSAQFMRQRSKMIFNAMRDSIVVHNEIESISFVGDTVKVIVHQSFKRKQFMAGKVRRIETSARQRESWMLTRDGWKLAFVDQVYPLTRVVDGIATDATKPFNPNDPAFKNN